MMVKVADKHKLSLQQMCLYFCHPTLETIKCKIYWNKFTSPLPPAAMLFLPKVDHPTLIIQEVGGLGLVLLIKINFVPNILHFIVDFNSLVVHNYCFFAVIYRFYHVFDKLQQLFLLNRFRLIMMTEICIEIFPNCQSFLSDIFRQ